MADLELCCLSTAEASRRIGAKELSPVALTEPLFARIAEADAPLRSAVPG